MLLLFRGRKCGRRWAAKGSTAACAPASPPSKPADSTASSSPSSLKFQHTKSGGGGGGEKGTDKFCYRLQLEQEVKILEMQLQEQINLHIALADAAGDNTVQPLSSCNLPEKVRELLNNVSALESAVSKLEEELISLHLCLCEERNESHYTKYHLMQSPALSSSSPTCSSGFSWEHPPLLRVSRMPTPCLPQPDLHPDRSQFSADSFDSCEIPVARSIEEGLTVCNVSTEEQDTTNPLLQVDMIDDLHNDSLEMDLWHHPNKLSEEMVRCMRNIFLCLSESSNLSSKNDIHCPSSPVGHLSYSSLTSFSGSTVIPSPFPSPSTDKSYNFEGVTSSTLDPYNVNWKYNETRIGSYSSAAEVSWMTVGKKQLEYAADALKKFRFLVEKLAKVNPSCMSCNERLAFWINLYNALMMHAYLAYGVPRNDMKLFSLMQKACYTVGGQSVSAADIEYVILKMKPPAHRPQIALVLALHKFKVSDEFRKYSVDTAEPLTLFALSCGMYSSPAVRIFTTSNINEELENSLKDFVRASVGINDKGKLLVPKLLYCFAKGVVEDSLLVDWICRFLSPDQVSIVRDSTSQRKQRLLGARSFSVLPFDSRFRYLFLPDHGVTKS